MAVDATIHAGSASGERASARAGRRATGVIATTLTDGLGAQLEAERERWILWLPVTFGLGILVYFWLPAEPRQSLAVLALIIAAVIAILVRRGTLAIVVASAGLAAASGFLAAKIRSDFAAAPVLERQLSNVVVEGFVELVEPRPKRGQRITLHVIRLGTLARENLPFRVRVRTMSTLDGLRPGEVLRLKATLAPPSSPALPGDYDFGRAAWFLKLGGVGYALQRPERIEHDGPIPSRLRVFAAIEVVRQAITQRIVTALPGETGAIAASLITGERGGIGEATNDAYRASGLFHILSISGLHMVVMAGAVFWTVRLVIAAVPGIALRIPAKKWAAVAAAVAALGYLLISGSQPATQRAYVMITIGFLAILVDRPAIALRTVALSALILLAIWPESLLDIGFQMSFAAVVALVAAYEEIRIRRNHSAEPSGPISNFILFFGGILLTTLIAGLAVAPLSAYYFHNSQQYAMVANLFAIPICNLVVMPAALAALLAMPFGLEGAPLWVMGLGIDAMTACARFVAAIPGSILRFPAMPLISFVLFVVGGLWLCLWRTRWRIAGVAMIAVALLLAPFKPAADVFVSRDGRLVAVRGADGRLSAVKSSSNAFELRRWLENDGDGRTAKEAFAAEAFRCDAIGCVAEVRQRRVALVAHPAALADDCREADIVIVRSPPPRACRPRGLMIDLFSLRDLGTHSLRLTETGWIATTVEELRGLRPWTEQGRRARTRTPTGWPPGQDGPSIRSSRLAAFAAPSGLFHSTERLRPEIEDDDGDAALDARD